MASCVLKTRKVLYVRKCGYCVLVALYSFFFRYIRKVRNTGTRPPVFFGTYGAAAVPMRCSHKCAERICFSPEPVPKDVGYSHFHLQISDEDREIYQEFTNLIYESLTSYMAEPRFNTDCAIFISRLEKALTTNLFETVIQKNADVIGSVVDCGYRYNNRVNIPNETVRNFLGWFRASTPQSQALVLNNFIAKISDIEVIEPDTELPF